MEVAEPRRPFMKSFNELVILKLTDHLLHSIVRTLMRAGKHVRYSSVFWFGRQSGGKRFAKVTSV